jgi:hypothetical protein
MKKQTKKSLELKLARIRALTTSDLQQAVGGLPTGERACGTGTGCGCTTTGPN